MMNGANGSNIYGTNGNAASLSMQWNPKHLEIKTRSVEKTLEPLVMQVSNIKFEDIQSRSFFELQVEND